MPPEVEDCVQSILDDHPAMPESRAYAICNDMENRGVLGDWLDADPEAVLSAALAEFRNPSQITRVEEGSGVRYKEVMLLSPGIWTDAGSQQTIHYSGEGIRASAENWIDGDAWRARREKVPADAAEVNFLHGPALYGAETLDAVGSIPTDSIVVDDQDRLYGDLVLHGETPQSETAIDLMDEVLEAAADPERKAPPVGPSVEIADDVVEETDGGTLEMTEAWLTGVGLVFNPASKPVEMEAQVRERAVAMAEDLGVDEGGLILRGGELEAGEVDEDGGDGSEETLNRAVRHGGFMGQSHRERFLGEIEDMRERLDGLHRTLQVDEEMAAVLDAVATWIEAEGSEDAPVTEFAAWAAENTDLEEADLNAVVSEYVEAVGAEGPEETPVGQFMDWLREQGSAEEGEGEGSEGTGEGEGEGELSEEDLEKATQTISEFNSKLEDVKDMLAEHEDAREDLSENLEDIERRLASIEDEEEQQGRVMTEAGGSSDFFDGDTETVDEGEHEDVLL